MVDQSILTGAGGHGGHGGHGLQTVSVAEGPSTLLAEALVANRDGIVGRWRHPAQPPTQLKREDAENLKRWSPEWRGQVFDFEIGSGLAFTAEAAEPGAMTIWHATLTAATPPTASYQPVFRLTRPSIDVFAAQIDIVANYADLRGDREAEVLSQLNGALPFFCAILYLSRDRKPYTMELLDTVFRSVQMTEMRLKHALASRRPLEYSPQIQPMIETPNHSSFPSGHATESFAYAVVLIRLLAEARNTSRLQSLQLMRQAARVAINRQVAGVHFPVDTAAGAVLGLTLGNYLASRFAATSAAAGQYQGWKFAGHAIDPAAPFAFQWDAYFDVKTANGGSQIPGPYVTTHGAAVTNIPKSDLLNWLWVRAALEWD